MTATDLVQTLSARGVRLKADGDRLRFHPIAKVTGDLLDELRRHKAAILEQIRQPSEPSTELASCVRLLEQFDEIDRAVVHLCQTGQDFPSENEERRGEPSTRLKSGVCPGCFQSAKPGCTFRPPGDDRHYEVCQKCLDVMDQYPGYAYTLGRACRWNYLTAKRKEKNMKQFKNDAYWGVCPTCGDSDGYLNIYKDQWIICHEHKVRWYIGRLFSSWMLETDADWQENWERIESYRDIGKEANQHPRVQADWAECRAASDAADGNVEMCPGHPISDLT